MQHQSFFLPEKEFVPNNAQTHEIYIVESKEFLPLGKVDRFKNPIRAPDAFYEGNTSNISTII